MSRARAARSGRSRRPASRRRGRRAAGARRFDLVWLLLGAVAIACLGGAFWLVTALEEPPLDETTLCPTDGPTAGTVIVLDLTDPVEPSQLALIRQRIEAEIRSAGVGTLFAVGLVRPEAAERGARFVICKPQSGADANELYENPRMIEERYVSAFQVPLEAALSAMLSSGVADSSPILESLQATLADAAGFSEASYPRRLIIVSDLLQHSSAFSFYRGNTWRSFTESPDFRRLARNLGGVSIEILRLPRPRARIGNWEDVDDFWVRYFEHQGVAQVRPTTIGDL